MRYEQLSKEQQEFIDNALSGKNILVDACIGSGKTSSIQALCNMMSGKNILYLTYNRLLKIDAKEKIQMPRVLVQNYNGFAYICLRAAGVSCGISDQFQTFNKIKPKLPARYDVLIIDEYQDIEAEMTDMLWHIKDSCPGLQIIAVGDMEQKIYDKTVLDVPEFMDEFLGVYTKMNFTRCFRLSKNIAARYGRIWGKPIIGVNDECKVQYMAEYQVTSFLASHDPSEILCLGARTGAMSRVLNKLETNYSDKFNKATVYASIADRSNGDAVEPTNDVAIFTTFDSSKGLERDICVVFDYTEDYWVVRAKKPSANQMILRNIFCVAGSRGKKHIIFVKSNNKDMVSEETLTHVSEKSNTDFNKPFAASEMYDFKYREDVEAMYRRLDIEPVQVFNHEGIEDTTSIEIAKTDDMIDLTPCIGEYQEASFFRHYDIEKELDLAAKMRDQKIKYRTENPDLKEKILALTAVQTKYDRYIKQAKLDFISESHENELHNRLGLVFNGDETVQQDCSILVRTEAGTELTFNGRIDAIKNDDIYELKFKDEIAHEDYLQLAFYLVATNRDYGYIWDTKTNQMFKVHAPEENWFVSKLVETVTKHKYHKGSVIKKDSVLLNMDQYHNKKRKDKSPRQLERERKIAKLFLFEKEWFDENEKCVIAKQNDEMFVFNA